MKSRRSESVPSEPTGTEKQYQGLLALEARSGLSRREFARQQRVPPQRLAWWKHEIGRRERVRAARAKETRPAATAPLVPVRVVEREAASAEVRGRSGGELEVQLARSGHVLRLSGTVDAAQIASLVQALEGASC